MRINSKFKWRHMWHLQTQQAVVLIATLGGLLITGLVVSDSMREHAHEVRAAGANTQNLTRILEEHTRQSLRRVELALSQSAQVLKGSSNSALVDPNGTRQVLQALLPKDGLLRALVVVDPAGTIVSSTLTENVQGMPSVDERDYFVAQRNQDGLGLVFGAAIKNRISGEWSIPVSIRLGKPDGAFDGVLMGMLEPGYFHRFYESIETGPNGFITLFNRQGWIIARSPTNEALLGRNWSASPMFSEHLPVSAVNTVRQVVVADGIDRIYSYRALTDYPVVVSVGQSLTDILAPWRKRVWAMGLLLVVVIAGLVGATLAVLRQLHRRHQAESALKLNELSVQTASVPAFWIAPSGRILRVNRAACDLHGYTEAQLLSMSIPDLDPDFPKERWPIHWQELRQARSMCFETTQVSRDGTVVPIELELNLIEFEGQEYNFAYVRDIRARMAVKADLVQATEIALAASQAKSRFLANMSHEIRTPMNAILGMLKLLQRTDMSARQLDYTTKTESAAKSLLGLLNDILDFSKIDAGKLELDPQVFSLDGLLRDLSFIVSANLREKPVEVLFDISESVPKTLVGDAMRLQQVLINLAGNAIKFTAQGQVVVQIKVPERTDTSATLAFAVTDSGIGIAPENQAHIFDGFAQAEASTTRRFGGTGLGLSISKRLVELMGGTLQVESVLGQGSNFHFTITLPVKDEPQVLGPAAAAPAPFPVLVVDDNAIARDLHVAMAQSLGWQVDAAATGAQALALVTSRMDSSQPPYQAILTDWEMPGMDGWDTISNILQLAPEEKSPITVMVTAHGREMLTERSAQEQARLHAFLVKPVTSSMLSDAVADARAGRGAMRLAPRVPVESVGGLQGMRLLLVEDNLVNQQVASELLTAEGATVVLADNGQLGVAAVAHANPPFDAVLMDVQMPVMDGYAATYAIRNGLGLVDLPIIAMTANAMASDRETCLAAGMNDHVGKPFDLSHLVSVLQIQTGRTTKTTRTSASMRHETVPPAVDAVNVEAALARMGGKEPLYLRTLNAFLQELAGVPDRLDGYIASGEFDQAARLMHTFKGVSATVGASYLAAVIKAAELRIKSADASADHGSLRGEVRAAVQGTLLVMGEIANGMAARLSDGHNPPPQIDSAHMLADLLSLHTLLADADMGAMESYALLRQTYSTLDSAQFDPLDLAMAALDFETAAAQCAALIVRVQAHNSGHGNQVA